MIVLKQPDKTDRDGLENQTCTDSNSKNSLPPAVVN